MNDIYTILIGLIIISVIVVAITIIIKKNNTYKINTECVPYLDKMIDDITSHYIVYELEIQKFSYMSEKYFNIALIEITAQVLKAMPESLKNNLYTCFSKEGLIQHIIMQITPKLSAFTVQKRKKK